MGFSKKLLKGLNTKDTTLAPHCIRRSAGKYTKGEKNLDLIGFSFEIFVSFVFEKSYHVKNCRRKGSHSNLFPTMSKALISAATQGVDGYSSANRVQII